MVSDHEIVTPNDYGESEEFDWTNILEKQGEILELVEDQQMEIEKLQAENRELSILRQQN